MPSVRRQEMILLLGSAACLAVAGCQRGPSRVDVPDFDPQANAEQAIELADQDGDGVLSSDELQSMPGVLAAIESIDTDGSGSIDQSELADRIASYVEDETGIMSLTCIVHYNGAPLSGAEVQFTPEPFLEDALKPAVSKTRKGGAGPVKLADGSLPGIAPGLYRVSISKMQGGQEMLPAKYNAETELGFEAAISQGGKPAKFDLRR